MKHYEDQPKEIIGNDYKEEVEEMAPEDEEDQPNKKGPKKISKRAARTQKK